MTRTMTVMVMAMCALFLLTDGAVADSLLYIQPIQIRSDDGTTAANAGRELFEAEGDKIWSQAGIDLVFLPWTTVDDTSLLSFSSDANNASSDWSIVFADPTSYGGSGDATIVNMWFAEDLDGSTTFYGQGWIDRAGVVIGWDAVASFNGGVGRLDTIAHELGHNLNLRHNNFGAGGADNLMTTGGSRSVPGSIDDITPDGLGLSILTAEQIAEAQGSHLLKDAEPIPEPGSVALLGVGLAGMLVLRKRKRRMAADS